MAYSTTDTFGSIIDEVISNLQGYGTDSDAVCTLTSTLSATATSFTVDETDNIGRGIIELDGEIMYVSYAENGTVYLPAWGRGYKGTTKATHATGAPVWIAPTWPRSVVGREINNMVRAVYPQLLAIGTMDFQASLSNTWQYTMPVDVERVLSVQWRYGGFPLWEPVRAWEQDFSGNTTDFATGKSLILGDPLPAAADIHVVYAKQPSYMASESDLFTSTGLPSSCKDVITLGVSQRLIPWQDTARLPVTSVPSDALDNAKPVGNAQDNAKYIRALYQARLDEEVRHQLSKYPTRSHRIR